MGLFKGLFALAVAGLVAGAAIASDDTAKGDAAKTPARYTMNKAGDGFLRLDTVTGKVSHCREKTGGWACVSAADDRSALDDEIARLARENKRLKDRVVSLEKNGASRGPSLPTEEDLNKVFGFFEKMVRRFMDFARYMRENFADGEV